MAKTEFQKKINTLAAIQSAGAGIGLLGGIMIAYRKKKGFWGYVGFMLLGSIAGNVAAGLVTVPIYLNLSRENAQDNQTDNG